MLNKEDILALAWEYSEGSGKHYTFTEETLFAFLKELTGLPAPAQDELESFKRWAEVEYNVNPNTEELNLSHIEVKASLKGWQARAARAAQKVNNVDTPEQQPEQSVPEGYVLLPKQCPSWLEDVYDWSCREYGMLLTLYLPAYDAMVKALEEDQKLSAKG